ncbi:MAG: DUF6285 domain-containing protein [Beijerinckiaceae bacterium]
MTQNMALPGLIAAAEQLLRDKVLTDTQGDTRFAGLMVASALGMAQRELELAEFQTATERDVTALAPQPSPFPSDAEALVQLMRVGMMDSADDVYRRLLAAAVVRTAITRPAVVTAAERRLAGME